MTREAEHIHSARMAAEELGATFSFVRKRKAYIATIGFNGQTRKTSISVSPSDWRVNHKIAIIIQRCVMEMKDGTSRHGK